MQIRPDIVAKAWLAIRPIRLIRQAIQARRGRKRARSERTSEGLGYEVTEGEFMANDIVLAILRHVMTFGGGAGLVSENELAQAAGAITTLLGVAWSIWQKRKSAKGKA